MPAAEAGPPASAHDLTWAERTCAEAGGKLTAPRRDVLSLLLASGHPLAAYDLIERMQSLRGQTHPPTVYRALEFLEQVGLIHRISTCKAYVPCNSAANRHRPVFLVCRVCKSAVEVSVPAAETLLQSLAQAIGFECERIVQEVEGRCSACVASSRLPA